MSGRKKSEQSNRPNSWQTELDSDIEDCDIEETGMDLPGNLEDNNEVIAGIEEPLTQPGNPAINNCRIVSARNHRTAATGANDEPISVQDSSEESCGEDDLSHNGEIRIDESEESSSEETTTNLCYSSSVGCKIKQRTPEEQSALDQAADEAREAVATNRRMARRLERLNRTESEAQSRETTEVRSTTIYTATGAETSSVRMHQTVNSKKSEKVSTPKKKAKKIAKFQSPFQSPAGLRPVLRQIGMSIGRKAGQAGPSYFRDELAKVAGPKAAVTNSPVDNPSARASLIYGEPSVAKELFPGNNKRLSNRKENSSYMMGAAFFAPIEIEPTKTRASKEIAVYTAAKEVGYAIVHYRKSCIDEGLNMATVTGPLYNPKDNNFMVPRPFLGLENIDTGDGLVDITCPYLRKRDNCLIIPRRADNTSRVQLSILPNPLLCSIYNVTQEHAPGVLSFECGSFVEDAAKPGMYQSTSGIDGGVSLTVLEERNSTIT